MEFTQKRGSSAVSKAALAVAIPTAAIAATNAITGIVGGRQAAQAPAGDNSIATLALLGGLASQFSGGQNIGGGSPDFVTGKEMTLIRENSAQGNVIARLESEKYAEQRISESLAPVYEELKTQAKEICDLKAGLAMESERRACGDEGIYTFVEGNYIKAEKGINSKKINYHNVRPVVRFDDCCGEHHDC